jgi:ubiquinone/menaquinone biosynthesis C-methylase UbiE
VASISFDRIADQYDQTRGGVERGRRFAPAIAAQLPAHARVLEIGVGTGAIAKPLADAGFDIVGVDLSAAMLRRARVRLGARVANASAFDLPVATGSVAAVMFVWVLHVVGDPDRALAEARRVLAAGGRLVVIPADADAEDSELGGAFTDLHTRLALGRDDVRRTCARAEAAGFTQQFAGIADAFEFPQSPNELADLIEQRTFSALWDLDDEQWQRSVVPVLDRLRALPEPDRRRERRLEYPLLVFTR